MILEDISNYFYTSYFWQICEVDFIRDYKRDFYKAWTNGRGANDICAEAQ